MTSSMNVLKHISNTYTYKHPHNVLYNYSGHHLTFDGIKLGTINISCIIQVQKFSVGVNNYEIIEPYPISYIILKMNKIT